MVLSSAFKFEGILGAPVLQIDNLNQNAQAFLPYNPTIVEVGAYEGAGTLGLAQSYPHGRIFACEPNPRAFAVLEDRLRGRRHVTPVNVAFGAFHGEATLHLDSVSGEAGASFVPPRRPLPGDADGRGSVRTSVAVLDEWCAQHGVTHVEFLRLDAGGLELQILQSSPRILKTILVVVTKTHFDPPSASVISYGLLKYFLEIAGFELLSHWYEEGREGEATFVRRILYDSVFR